jgi:ribosomal-protein-alanine acetyltransferase
MQNAVPDIELPEPRTAIRAAFLADIPSLIRIEEQSFLSDRMSPRSFRYLLTRANADCLVADAGGQVFGYAAAFYRLGTKVARLHSIAVDPRAQRSGIGGKLLTAIEIAARRHGAKTLRLAVRKDNHGAARLYRAFGFRETGVESRYYSDGMAALTMEKSLAAA